MINILLFRPSFKKDILLLGDILSFKMSRQIICVGGLKAKYQRDIDSEKRCPLLGNSASPTANRSSVATRAYKKGVERVPASFQRDRSAEARPVRVMCRELSLFNLTTYLCSIRVS